MVGPSWQREALEKLKERAVHSRTPSFHVTGVPVFLPPFIYTGLRHRNVIEYPRTNGNTAQQYFRLLAHLPLVLFLLGKYSTCAASASS